MDQTDQLLKVASDHARDMDAVCADVAAVIFPTASFPPSEATVNAVSSKLMQVVADIESALTNQSATMLPSTWPMLARAGMLREPDLIDFMLARVAEERLELALGGPTFDILVRLLDHPNGNVAEAGQALLAAQSLHRHPVGRSYLSMSPELLHRLSWRVTAALELVQAGRRPEIIAATKTLLAQYSEASRVQSSALKIVHFIGEDDRSALLHPDKAGVHLHVAALASKLDIDQDHVVRLIDASSSIPYAVMLAVAGATKPDARKALFLFRDKSLTAREVGIFDVGYDKIDVASAASEIMGWATARTAYLALGQ